MMINLNLLKEVKSRFSKQSFSSSKVASSLLSHISRYKILIIVFAFLSVIVGVLIVSRNHFISQLKIAQVKSTPTPSPSPTPTPESSPVASDSSVLGTSTEVTTYTPTFYPSSIPNPTSTPTPKPTSTPTLVNPTPAPSVSPPASSNSSSSHNCSNMGVPPGVATAWYSQASSPQTVGDTATINIELRDCNNNIAPVSDTLTISQQSSTPKTTVNGSSPPISLETRNGQVSFTVKSQTSGTVAYIVRNTTKSFNVTDPKNKHPQVTFNVSAPAATPTTTPTPSTSATPTPTSSLTPTSSPSSTSTPTPSPTPN